ncbi:wiskott-Aldrich syndrome protein family member 2 isoform X2 [Ctenocephalides felis]|uniref:wiskott-Aldrich syndrome protein family member 2 isoform X2 n=1 Tax=Ctenocephalides felis TaxID=7515 RepID=UPI000E6E41A8|nr:wiskott-Aldrich syndrome protein family member 2 isoform X2 [Ctenocephalides felis]
MPIPKRLVEPVHVARGTIPEDFPLPSELEAATNGTLANTVRQLSSLSRHAEDLFGELAKEAGNISERTNSLQARIDRLAIKVNHLDSTVEEVSLQDIHMRKAFKSNVVFDQQIFSRDTMPTAMLETYQLCDKPPPLHKLNCYRDDGKDGLKFYTDPNYFFELWRQEMLKDTERMMHDKVKKPHRMRTDGAGGAGGGGRHKKRVRVPHNTCERQRQLAVGHGETLMPHNVQYRTPHAVDPRYGDDGLIGDRPPRPNSIELRRSYSNANEAVDGGYGMNPPSPHHLHMQQQQQNAQQNAPPSPQHNHYAVQYTGTGQTYDETLLYQSAGLGPMSSESLYAYGAGGGTPSRTRPRPAHPPPAPPSNGSGGGTPNVSCANTPTRGRDNLPPPPPPPESMTSPPAPINGVAAHILARNSQSNSRSGSPMTSNTNNMNQDGNMYHGNHIQNNTQTGAGMMMHTQNTNSAHHHLAQQNANLFAQLNSQLNTITSQLNCANEMNDLPPPPPIPEQNPAAPPPPPPPPLPLDGATTLANGDATKSPPPLNKMLLNNGGSPPKLSPPKKSMLPPIVDPRNDLLKAIRDGIKLRKVEKISQKEVERGNAFHDVASILARRVAVEFSDSDSASDSEYDSEGWGEQETSA